MKDIAIINYNKTSPQKLFGLRTVHIKNFARNPKMQ